MNSTIRIVGLHSPLPQSGKSTIARHLAGKYAGRVYSIAGEIRQEAINRGMPFAAHAAAEYKDKPDRSLGGRSPRQVLISIGEEFTEAFGRDYWIKRLLVQIDRDAPYLAIIDDVRRLEEGLAIEQAGGDVITIQRAAARKVADVGGWIPRVTVENNGELHQAVLAVAKACRFHQLEHLRERVPC